MSTREELCRERVVLNPAILIGKPVGRGRRIPVYLVLEHLADDVDRASRVAAYPCLAPDDVRACLAHAAALVANEDLIPTVVTDATAAD